MSDTTPDAGPDVLDDDALNLGLPTQRDNWRERRLAHTPAERAAAAARLRTAQAEWRRVAPMWRAAIEERDAATLYARDVGMARRTIGRILGVPWGNVTRMQQRAVRRAAGQNTSHPHDDEET